MENSNGGIKMIKDVLVSVQPRKILWIVNNNDWGQFEEVIKYNCSIIGGYYNIILQLDINNQLDKVSLEYMISYDPDLIILPPNMKKDSLDISNVNPFDIVEWNQLNNYVNFSRDGISEIENIRVNEGLFEEKEYPLKNSIIAVEGNDVNYNRLALVACGDTFYSEAVEYQEYEEIKKSSFGYREEFLKNFVLNTDKLIYKENENIPNRSLLGQIINKKNMFPINNPISAIETCLKIQARPMNRYTFANLTSKYYNHEKYDERGDKFVILVSNNFELNDAIMFWNLRASGRYVSWISYENIKNNINNFVAFISNTLYEINNSTGIILHGKGLKLSTEISEKSTDILFDSIHSSNEEKKENEIITGIGKLENERLINLVNEINEMLMDKGHEDITVSKYYNEYKFFDYEIPSIEERRELINDNKLSLNYKYEDFGTYTVKLKSNEYMFPYNRNVERLINKESFKVYLEKETIRVPYIRISKDNYIVVQVSDEDKKCIINKPSLNSILDEIFINNSYSKLVLSSTGKYHKKYIELCKSFDYSVKYLKKYPYKEILELMIDNKSKKKPGWIIEHLDRRVLNSLEILKLLNMDEAKNFKELYDKIDLIPDEIFELHEKGILQKGVVLTCKECSYKYWYSIEEIGQKFKCNRCMEEQCYDINALWSYKLNEMVYQGLKSDMSVPLITIEYLEKISEHNFEWIIDSDFSESKNNLDIICSIDGKIFIGESKSCNYIEDKQFDFYKGICEQNCVDGIVFSTSQNKWDKKTLNLIEDMKKWFYGEVIILTYDDLYVNEDRNIKEVTEEEINKLFEFKE